MDRVAIKEKAKKMIVGNKWYLWKPLVFISLIIFAVTFVFGLFVSLLKLDKSTTNIIYGILSVVISLFEFGIVIGYAKYVIEFVSGNKMEWQDMLAFAKEHMVSAILVSIVVALIIGIGYGLFVIPGIVASLGLLFYQQVLADNPSLSVMEVIKKTWAITNNHKMDLFVFQLSFIGWILLTGFTFGLLAIWLVPYMTVSLVLAYEELKK